MVSNDKLIVHKCGLQDHFSFLRLVALFIVAAAIAKRLVSSKLPLLYIFGRT